MPASPHPIAYCFQIGGSGGGACLHVLWCQGPRGRVHVAEMIGRPRGLRRVDDAAGLVDPDALRHVDHAVQRRHAVVRIDQAPIGRVRLFDPWPSMLRAAAFFRHRYDHEILVPQASEHLLPHGQVKATASPGRPGGQEHFFGRAGRTGGEALRRGRAG